MLVFENILITKIPRDLCTILQKVYIAAVCKPNKGHKRICKKKCFRENFGTRLIADIMIKLTKSLSTNKRKVLLLCTSLLISSNIFTNYNQQDANFIYLFIYFHRCSTCFRRFLCPSSGAHNCTHIVPSHPR